MSLPARKVTVTINGQKRGPIDVPEGLMMIDVLHEMLGLTGSRLGCGMGICHACVVIWDRDDGTSEEVQSCITGADFFDGKRIRTIEGIARTRSFCRQCSRPFSTNSASSAAIARRASSTPPQS
jgi:aerobic-type carbon monoxide dehydrogenase small subunit (CoxS/CutS family)